MTNPPNNPWQQGQPEMNPPADSLGQPAADPYGQPAANAYGQPAADPYGQAYPAYGQPAGRTANLAGWFKRVGSHVIDWLPYTILNRIADPMVGGYDPMTQTDRVGTNPTLGWLLMVLGLVWFLYNMVYRDGKTGHSIGRQLLGTKLVSEADGQPIGMGKALLRQICHILDTIVCLLGYLWPLWDAKKQTFADKIMKTVVIDER
ncbi:RDD family protein [Luteococcus sp.]|uniref:RDD family protein n=1 Tax=Luteococcus sp. TaxID=1969402 RepID=UPI0037369442